MTMEAIDAIVVLITNAALAFQSTPTGKKFLSDVFSVSFDQNLIIKNHLLTMIIVNIMCC